MNITDVQLHRIAEVFGIEPKIDRSELLEACFERSYLACQKREWEFIDSLRIELSLLQNKIGHTLLIRALVRQEDDVVVGLAGKRIAVLTPDPYGHTPLCHLMAGASGENLIFYKFVLYEAAMVMTNSLTGSQWKKFNEAQQCVSEVSRDVNALSGTKLNRVMVLLENTLSLTNKLPEHDRLVKIEEMKSSIVQIEAEAHKASQYGGYRGAKNLYKEAIGWYRKYWGETHHHLSGHLFNLGLMYDRLGKTAKSIEHFEQSLALHIKLFGKKHEKIIRVLSATANAYADISKQHPRVRQYREEALALAQEVYGSQHEEVASCLADVGGVWSDRQDYAMAADYYERAMKIVTEKIKTAPGDKELVRKVAFYQLYLSSCRYEQGVLVKGLMLGKAALTNMEFFCGKEHPHLTPFLQILAKNYLLNKEFALAKQCIDQAIAITERVHGREHLMVSDILGESGEAYFQASQYVQALEHLKKAREICEKSLPHSTKKLARLLNISATIHLKMGDYSQAEACYNKAHELLVAKIGDEDPETLSILTNIGTFYHQVGLIEKAQEILDRISHIKEEVWHEAASTRSHTLATLSIGNLIGSSDDQFAASQAMTYQKRALGLAEKSGDVYTLRRALMNVAVTHMKLGEYAEAKQYFDRVDPLLESASDKESYAIYLLNLGSLCLEMGDIDTAIANRTKAVNVLEGSKSYLVANVHTSLGEVYLKQDDLAKAEQSCKEAVDICETARKKQPTDAWKIALFETQSQSYELLERIMVRRSMEKNQEALFAMSDFRRARSLVALIQNKIDPAGEVPPPLPFNEMYRIAEEQEATIVMYSCVMMGKQKDEEGALVVYIISPKRWYGQFLVPRVEFAKSVGVSLSSNNFPFKSGEEEVSDQDVSLPHEEVLAKLEDPMPEGLARKRAMYREEYRDKLRTYYDTLIRPFEELKFFPENVGEKVIFIPDASMATLPFHLFLDREGKYLFERYTVSTAPSITVLDQLSKRRQMREISPRCLIVDDPVSSAGSIKTGGQESDKLVSLLHSREEDVLKGPEASTTRVLSQMENAGTIHFSCHGSAKLSSDPTSVYQGGLHLAPDAANPSGYLLAEEVVKRQINADLVFTSACSTGLGKEQQDGVIGLIRSFLAAGADSVIASGWKVSDSMLTVLMIEKFYQLRTGETPLGKAQALRETMLYGKKLDEDAIEKWGVFFLTGLPGRNNL